MSGYARAAHALGAERQRLGRADGPYLRGAARRRRARAPRSATAPRTCPPGDDVELVYSSAVARENPERAAARERGLPELARAALLGELHALRRTIAVAGTHGKTTTVGDDRARAARRRACGPAG